MREAIIRIGDSSKDVEILVNNLVFDNEIIEKKMSFSKFVETLNDYLDKNERIKLNRPCKFIEPGVIGHDLAGSKEKYIINQPEHRRFITYSKGDDNQAYEVNFPSSIYVVYLSNNRISGIKAFMYLNWDGMNTKLYEYAMANMLANNNICIGNAEKDISNNSVIYSLEKIIYAPYSHDTLNNIKGFKYTKKYFEYLSERHVEEKYLIKTNLILNDLFNGKDKEENK